LYARIAPLGSARALPGGEERERGGRAAGHLGAAGAFDPFLFSKLLSREVTLLPLPFLFSLLSDHASPPKKDARLSSRNYFTYDTPGDISRYSREKASPSKFLDFNIFWN